MISGIYYGAQYGGSDNPPFWVNIPGEASSNHDLFDGYQMGWQGRAGPALGIAALVPSLQAPLGICHRVFGATLANVARQFLGPTEYFSLMFLH